MNDSKTRIAVLEAANRIAKLLNQSRHVDDAIEKLMTEFLELVQADEGSIQLLRPTTERTRLTLIRTGERKQTLLDSRLDDLMTGLTVSHRQPFATDDLAGTLDLGAAASRYNKIGSYISVPFLVKDTAIGVVNLIRTKEHQPFSENDKELVSSLAEGISDFIEQAQLREQLFSEYVRLQEELSGRFSMHGIIGRSVAMKEIFSLLERIIPTEGRVLIHGDSGTGKELIARILHNEGVRKKGPFVAIDCGALPPNLLESELFGYVRGAFTGANHDRRGLFEEANKGTLFLDEIANTSSETQAKLLRVLQEGEIRPLGSNQPRKVDVRIISAASVDLKKKIDSGEFRSDLFYRLNVVPIYLPPLRDRVEDIPALATHFLKRFCDQHSKQISNIDPASLKVLENYPWPGNVRELENVMERAVILAGNQDTVLLPEHLPYEVAFPDQKDEVPEIPTSGDLSKLVGNYEREILLKVLRHHNWNQSAAAKALNISERVIRYKIKRLKLKRPNSGS